MAVRNIEISAMLEKLADLLEIEGANPFRVRAYRNAAQTVAGQSRDLADRVAKGEDLSDLPGVGDAIAKKIREMVETGHLKALEKEEQHLPGTLVDLLKVPSLGPKRVHLIFEKLKISDRKELERAARSGQIRALPGMGEKTERTILDYLSQKREGEERMRLAVAEQFVEPLVEYLRAIEGVERVSVAGSYRRGRETVGDVDIVVVCQNAANVMACFTAYEDVTRILAQGDTKSSVMLRIGLQVDLRVVPDSSHGAAMQYFTGSKEHNIALRTRAVKAGLKLNEYGLFQGDRQVAGGTEESVYAALQLPLIEPELRENRGELHAAEEGVLPELVTLDDICGDLQSHTTESDGHNTLEEMADAAQRKGYKYLAVTDHSKRVAMAHGLNATRLARQMHAVDTLNEKLSGFRILKSIEVDILEDGSLDLGDDILAQLDVVVCAVHYGSTLTREHQTERIIRAMDNPHVHILAHPTGRLIGERDPYAVDMERLVSAAAERGCFLELNAHPARLDLNDIYCRMAHDASVKIAVSTDAHSAADLDLMRFGITQARRGWLTRDDVLNTRPWAELKTLLRRA